MCIFLLAEDATGSKSWQLPCLAACFSSVGVFSKRLFGACEEQTLVQKLRQDGVDVAPDAVMVLRKRGDTVSDVLQY